MGYGLSYRLRYAEAAQAQLRRLSPDLKPLVKSAIESLQVDPFLGKELQFDLAGYRSVRARRYRIIYRVCEERRVVEIHYFGHRRSVYETVSGLLAARTTVSPRLSAIKSAKVTRKTSKRR